MFFLEVESNRHHSMRYLLDLLVNRGSIVEVGGGVADSPLVNASKRTGGKGMVLYDGRLDQRKSKDKNRRQQRDGSQ